MSEALSSPSLCDPPTLPVDTSRSVSQLLGDSEFNAGTVKCPSGDKELVSLDAVNEALARYKETWEVAHLDEAIRLVQIVNVLVPKADAHSLGELQNCYGTSLYSRYQRLVDVNDLVHAIEALHQAVDLTPDSLSNKPILLGNYATTLFSGFERFDNLKYLELSIEAALQAVALTSDDDPQKPTRLNNYGTFIQSRFERCNDLGDLERAIEANSRAVELTRNEETAKPILLHKYGLSLYSRYRHSSGIDDLACAIQALREAAELTLDGELQKPSCLSNLGMMLHSRFEVLDTFSDLELAIEATRQAVLLTTDNHPDKPPFVGHHGLLLQRRFERLGELSDLEGAIKVYCNAIELQVSCAGRLGINNSPWLSNYASLVHCHSEHTKVISATKAALAAEVRYEKTKKAVHLDLAIELYRQVVDNASMPNATVLSALGSCLMTRLRLSPGNLDDLKLALYVRKQAVDLTPDDHPAYHRRISNLACSFEARFARSGEVTDIEQAINLFSSLVELTPDHNPDKPIWLNNLALSLQHYPVQPEDRNYRDFEVTKLLRRACELTPDGHPSKPIRLMNLAATYRGRFEHGKNLGDLEMAIEAQRQLVQLTSDRDTEKPSRLINLGMSLVSRFEFLNELGDLERAIEAQRRAVELAAAEHSDDRTSLFNLGCSLVQLFHKKPSKETFDSAIECLLEATARPFELTQWRLDTNLDTLRLLENNAHYSSAAFLLLAHSRIIELLPESVWLGYSISRRLEESRRLGSIVTAAVQVVIAQDRLYQAVEWLEQGRALMWSQVLSFRDPLEDLQVRYPDLANTLRRIREQLQTTMYASSISDEQVPIPSSQYMLGTFAGDESEHHRQLAIKYGRTLAEVRNRPGFERFLRPMMPDISASSAALIDGPIVFINVHNMSCHAVILSAGEKISQVALTELSSEKGENLCSLWRLYLRDLHVRARRSTKLVGLDDSDGGLATRVLCFTWNWVVHPVLRALGLDLNRRMGSAESQQLPRITWCPTGPLTQLPLHAAGIYEDDTGPRVYDFVVSSYAPSLSAITRAIVSIADARSRPQPSILVVTQPHAPGLPPIPATTKEGTSIKDIFSMRGNTVTLFDEQDATVDAVRANLKQHSWLHLACHGSQNNQDPTKSAFALYDDPLTLGDLMSTTADNAELAFLSACQTAAGDERIPEESMHLAAGMLAVGFKGVVATMWSVKDEDAPLVVEKYYKALLKIRASGELGKRETGAAYALHAATRRLREEVGVKEFVRWAPFVHFGI